MNPFVDSKKYFKSPLQEFMFFDKYSRFNYELGRRETWIETVDRAVDFLKELSDYKLENKDYERIRTFILEMKVMPSMRLLAMAGEAARRNHISLYNCAFLGVNDIRAFAEALYISISGCGVGFSVEHKHIDKLPALPKRLEYINETYTIEDTSEGWYWAIYNHIYNLYNGKIIDFDYSALRPAGSVLKTKGGRASGPQALHNTIAVITSTFSIAVKNEQDRLKSIQVHDIMCSIGQCAISGGVRRTAMISIFDFDDKEMRYSKIGKFPTIRYNANNSNVIPVNGITQEEFDEMMNVILDGGYGEPGIFNLQAIKNTTVERRDWKKISGNNPCLTGDTLVYTADGRKNVTIKELADIGDDVPVFCLDNKGSVTVRYMRNPRITGFTDVFEVLLDDGSTIKATKNHKFLLNSGKYVELKDLKPNDSLYLLTKYQASIKEIFKANSNSQDYWWISNGQRKTQAEHRPIAEFHNNAKIPAGYVVHHIDFNAQNNTPENLSILSKEDHDFLHSRLMLGDSNPMRRAKYEWSNEKWAEYKDKMSVSVSGESNGKYSGITNNELKIHAIELTKKLGRRFSTEEWVEYSKENGLPQSFSKWRQDHLGGISGLSKWAVEKLELDDNIKQLYKDLDTRIIRRYQKLLDSGYDVELCIDGTILINKYCELCGKEFKTERQEVSFCGLTCYSQRKRLELVEKATVGWENKHVNIRKNQINIFNELKNKLNRIPLKREWANLCKQRNTSCEISRKTSPFTSWGNLIEAASNINHKVVSIRYIGKEVVYNGTVDDFHNFFVGGFTSTPVSGKEKIQYVNNLQCGEIMLRDMQFCNLSSVVCREDDTMDSLGQKVAVAGVIGTIQSMATKFPLLRPQWKLNCEEERLLGVSLNGQMDCPILLNDNNNSLKEYLKAVAISSNKMFATKLGIKHSTSVTCVKPEGNSSQLLNCSSGAHPRYAKYYIRRVRVDVKSPIYEILFSAGVPLVPENGQDWSNITTAVASFPIKSPEKSVVRDDLTAIEFLEYWKKLKLFYTEHNPSITIYVRDEEKEDVKQWIWQNLGIINGMTLLPYSNHKYQNAPYEEITEEQYESMIKTFPNIDWSLLENLEKEDMTTAAQELACMGGQCLV